MPPNPAPLAHHPLPMGPIKRLLYVKWNSFGRGQVKRLEEQTVQPRNPQRRRRQVPEHRCCIVFDDSVTLPQADEAACGPRKRLNLPTAF